MYVELNGTISSSTIQTATMLTAHQFGHYDTAWSQRGQFIKVKLYTAIEWNRNQQWFPELVRTIGGYEWLLFILGQKWEEEKEMEHKWSAQEEKCPPKMKEKIQSASRVIHSKYEGSGAKSIIAFLGYLLR